MISTPETSVFNILLPSTIAGFAAYVALKYTEVAISPDASLSDRFHSLTNTNIQAGSCCTCLDRSCFVHELRCTLALA